VPRTKNIDRTLDVALTWPSASEKALHLLVKKITIYIELSIKITKIFEKNEGNDEIRNRRCVQVKSAEKLAGDQIRNYDIKKRVAHKIIEDNGRDQLETVFFK